MSIDFKINESNNISGVYEIEPSISTDLRGNIWTSFLQEKIEKLLPKDLSFKHDKFSCSEHNVLRGIHGDSKSWKLVTCVFGEIQQVVVDYRKESPTYLTWESFIINQEKMKLILLPPYMGNAYYVLSNKAVYHYKLAYQGKYIDADKQFSYKWNDERVGIEWMSRSPILSERDQGQ